MTHHQSTLGLIAKGALAGIAGTAALTAGMALMPHVLPETGPFDPERDQTTQPQEKLVESVMLALWGTLPDQQTKAIGGQAAHWGYGATWGTVYALAQEQLQLPPNTHGLLLGLLVGTTASTVVPALQLAPPPTRQPLPQTAMMTALQLLFGWVTAQTFEALTGSHEEHERQRAPRWEQRNHPHATHRYPGRPDGEIIERRFEQVEAPMPRHYQSLAEPSAQPAATYS